MGRGRPKNSSNNKPKSIFDKFRETREIALLPEIVRGRPKSEETLIREESQIRFTRTYSDGSIWKYNLDINPNGPIEIINSSNEDKEWKEARKSIKEEKKLKPKNPNDRRGRPKLIK